MADLKDRARRFFRRASVQHLPGEPSSPAQLKSISTTGTTSRGSSTAALASTWPRRAGQSDTADLASSADPTSSTTKHNTHQDVPLQPARQAIAPQLTLERPSPDAVAKPASIVQTTTRVPQTIPPTPVSIPTSPALVKPEEQPPRKLHAEIAPRPTKRDLQKDYFGVAQMERRKVWVRRAGASPTLVQVLVDDLVDDVRDKVLLKFRNSLGHTWDAPDVSIRITPRERSHAERILNPDESIISILDAYFPGGQHVEEALLIDVPRRRTPQASPPILLSNIPHYGARPMENGTDYFPPMPAASPHPSQSGTSHESRHSYHPTLSGHSISILETGQLPPLPSPRSPNPTHRPMNRRQNTSSPNGLGSHGSGSRQHGRQEGKASRGAPPAPPAPTPPVTELMTGPTKVGTPPVESGRAIKKKGRNKGSVADAQLPDDGRLPPPPKMLSLIEASVPPISVLIVEDNPINLKLLEKFTTTLKVRWASAMNGRDAVSKWRDGGFHLVLMDIQLPIMSGLEATKEIRRLERLNGIGIFAKGDEETKGNPETAEGNDKITDKSLFKSPVIIVALTASNLQSDRHEALAAGCNDFITKPVAFPWLERKIMEWGCMQALIDFDGYRKWKDMAAAAEEAKQREEDQDPAAKAKREKKEAKRAALLQRMAPRA